MASASFHDSLNSLGWSRRGETPASTQSSTSAPFFSKIQSWNPLGSGRGGYVQLSPDNAASSAPLPAPTRREEEEAWFARECCPLTHCPSVPFSSHLLSSHSHPYSHSPTPFLHLVCTRFSQRDYPSCDILACYLPFHMSFSLSIFSSFLFSILFPLCFFCFTLNDGLCSVFNAIPSLIYP